MTHLISDVRWIAVNLLALGNFRSRADTDNASILHDDFIDRLVKHVSSSVDGRQASEALGQLSESVHRVQVRRLSVASQRVGVQLDAANGDDSGLAKIVVVAVQGQSVASEILSVLVQAELVVERGHVLCRRVEVLPRLRVIFLEVLDVDEEVAEAALLEHA